ncbi:MAG: hypothetical protein HY561_01905 [Gemmatimonadetes bacterium]|nr:hypothetical protein [Gemmatimonadota bacterium]
MAKRRAERAPEKTALERARDELFSHIHRCGVLRAEAEHQQEWMADTMQFMAERYPELSSAELEQLKELGLRFCQPVIRGGEDREPPQEDANAA